MKKILVLVFFVGVVVFSGQVKATTILFENFDDSSGFTTGGGSAAYWGISPLAGTTLAKLMGWTTFRQFYKGNSPRRSH